jgi:glycine dehydrogenase subunit 1
MLSAIGVESTDDLYADIPISVRANGLDLSDQMPEQSVAEMMERFAAANRTDLVTFLGAGAYRHYIPAAVDEMIRRSEFYTAYTPYQPEVSQGTLQAIYEYQSLMAELTGLPVVSASHYDGATATAEAALMTLRATKRNRVLISRAVNRQYVDVTRTYLAERFELDELPTLPDGTTDLTTLERLLAEAAPPVGGVIVSQPNAFGLLEDMAAVADMTHAAGAMFAAVVEPVSLAVLAPPGEYGADVAAGEGQPLGIPLQYGGPYLGILSCSESMMRQIPGRLIGRTTDSDGQLGYTMTLRAREQDIRREKAASNICTNQSLCALAATVYLSVIGPDGLADVASSGAAAARELEYALDSAGAPRMHEAPFLNEFAVRVPDAARVHGALLERGILAGLPLSRWFPDDDELRDALLVCATETTTSQDISAFAGALEEVLR